MTVYENKKCTKLLYFYHIYKCKLYGMWYIKTNIKYRNYLKKFNIIAQKFLFTQRF